MASCRQGRHQASNQNSTGFGLKNFFRAPPARSAGKPMEHSYRYWLRFGTRSGCQNFRASFHQASNQNSTGFGLKNFFRAPPARSAGKPIEHSYRYWLRFGGPIWLPKLPSIFPRVFENFQATDRSISHARRYRFPKIATGNRTILVSLSMFYGGHRWYMYTPQPSARSAQGPPPPCGSRPARHCGVEPAFFCASASFPAVSTGSFSYCPKKRPPPPRGQ